MSGTEGTRDAAGDLRRDDDDLTVTRHEERAEVGTELHESGRVRVRKHVETLPVEQVVERSVEHADDSERVPAAEGDSGEVETLEDGSVSIPVFEEVLVVTKKLVVRERVIVRKRTVVDEHTLRTELRREHVTFDTEGDADLAGTDRDPALDQRMVDRPDELPARPSDP
jgi:uncharacterized protein (TIGR02271 family)